MKKVKSIVLFGLLGLFVDTLAQESFLDTYISEGLQNNLSLQQVQADYEKSVQALHSARGLFYPNLSIDARYTVARGGRIIEFPVGDLLNPVYSTLNQLTQSDQFPQLQNEAFPFYRPNEQETKINLLQPVYNPKILYNYQIEKEKCNIARTDVTIYKRELIREIKTAYYNYLKTVYIQQLIGETMDLLKENLRVSKSLFDNDMVTNDVVYRSEAELQKIIQNQAEAEKASQTAKAYFNFLLNKPLDQDIQFPEYKSISELSLTLEIGQEMLTGVNSREEIKQLETYGNINEEYLKLVQSSNFPSVFVAVNYGFQGEEYSFTRNDDFMLASIVLQWNLFSGFKNRADVQQAKIAKDQLDLKQLEVQKQIELQIINAYYDIQAAAKAVDASRAQAEASEKAFKVVEEKYRQGQAPLIEYIDAQTTMSNSKQSLIIAYFDFKIREADYERATASGSLQ
jgi:outer membrane protein TolC